MATFRPVTDGAGQEIEANLDAIITILGGGTASAATSASYTSKQLLTEETGRSIASKLASIMTKFVSYIAPSAKKVQNKLTIGASTYDGSAAVTAPNASTSQPGLMSAADKTKLDGIESGAQKNTITGVKGNSESSYRTGNVNVSAANILGSSAIGGTAKPIYYTGSGFAACGGSVGGENTPVYMSSGTFTAGVPNNLEDMSWAQISAISKAGKAASIFHVGQEKKISLSTGEEVTAVILGFNHDDLADGSGKAGITFGLKNALKTTYNMNSSNTNAGGWSSSAMRTRMSTFKGYLPSALQSVIRAVTKKTSAGSQSSTINSTSDELFLFSHIEVFGTYNYNQGDSPTQRSFAGEGKQYEYYKGKTWCSYYSKPTVNSFGTATTFSANVYYQENGYKGLGDTATSANPWWLRSPDSGNGTIFCCVSAGGSAGNNGASTRHGAVFGFCI